MVSQRDIVLLAFPFSDLRTTKVRPTIVISSDEYNKESKDVIVVPLTSNLRIKDYTLLVTKEELESGKLVVDSKAKVDRIFSVSKELVRMKIGRVKIEVHGKIREMLFKLLF